MSRYNANTLEKQFKSAAALRIRKQKKGVSEYAKDAKYWDGGQCQWGGGHNLSEDCKKISRNFEKIEDLKNAKKELENCTSAQEFDSTKSRLVRQAGELEKGLQSKTSNTSSIFGVCIIWHDYTNFLDSKLRPLRKEIERLKQEINKSQYKYFQELKVLKLERKQIEDGMKENERKAMTETDPEQKALLLQLIEEDGEKLKQNLKKQKEVPIANLKFESDKYVSDLIEAMKKAIERGNDNNYDSDDDNNIPKDPQKKKKPKSDEGSTQFPNGSAEPESFFEQYKTQIFIGLALALTFYLYSQKETNQLTHEDYKQIKKLQKQVNALVKKIKNDPILKSFVEDCQNNLNELEQQVPNRIKATGDYESCFHRNIQWNKELEEIPYCADCGTTNDNSAKFLKALCRFYYQKVEQWLRSHNLKINKSNLGENNHSLYRQLVSNDFVLVNEIHQTYNQIEKKLNEIAKEKGIENIDNNKPKQREREREREQIQSEISNLENKPNKTAEEKAELEQKRKQLEQLDKNSEPSNSKEPTNWTPWIVGGLVLVGVLGIAAYFYKRKKPKQK